MPHLITMLAIVYVVLTVIYSAYVPAEDYAFMVWILAVLMPIVILAIGVDKLWGIMKVIHPVVALAIAVLVGIFVVMAGQSLEDSMPFIVIIVTLVVPMLIISLCINFRGFNKI